MFRFHSVLVAYAVAIPLALMLGYLVATPDVASIAVVGMVLFFLALPLLIQWNHGLLIFFWNSAFIAGFLPVSLQLWAIFAWLTFGMGVVHYVMGHKNFLRAPELTKPILMLLAVELLTMKVRGGFGMRSLGSGSFGGKNYFYIATAIVGYFALISQPTSVSKRFRAANSFFLSSLSYSLPNLIYALGPAFYFLFVIVPPDFVGAQAGADFTQDIVKRYAGFGLAATGVVCLILARWGIRGLADLTKPWRLLLFIIAFVTCLFSGFRSHIVFLALLLAVQFIVEGLWKTYLLPVFLFLGVLGFIPMLFFANEMPAAIQRSLAFLPIEVDSNVRAETINSSEWRYAMWRATWPEVPKYLLIGKGYALDPVDLYLTFEAARMGIINNYEGAMLAGDYHNGPLTVLMPFGMFGAIAFIWLLAAGIKVLHCNRRYGDPKLKSLNTLFFSYFLAQTFFFFFVFGAFNTGLAPFLGVLGLSVSFNGGVCRKTASRTLQSPVPAAARLVPA